MALKQYFYIVLVPLKFIPKRTASFWQTIKIPNRFVLKICTGGFADYTAKGSTLRHNIIHVTKKVNSDVQRCLLSATQSYGDADSTTVCENLFYVAENSCFLLGNSTNNFF